jgi:L,D-transpeptidase catalytic domain
MKTHPCVLACFAFLLTLPELAAAAQTPPKNTSTLGTAKTILPAELKPGEYAWHPEFSPKGPMVLIVSLPEQLAYVYRNGVIIGASTVSTGKKGHETPTGVFTILQKDEDHYSSLYNDAPMPYMQRLTWSGVAIHAGRLPGYPASHGCVRMPYEFAQLLYRETKTGLTVIVSDEKKFPSTVAHPGLVAPVDAKGTLAGKLPSTGDIAWQPEAAPEGPVTILITNEDKRIRIFRAGVEIGHAPFTLTDPNRKVTLQVLTQLEASTADPISAVTGKPIIRWLSVSGDQETTVTVDELLAVISVAPEFLRQAETVVGPGTTIVIAQPASTTSTTTAVETDFTVITGEK